MAISAIAGLAALGGAALGGLVTSFAVGLGFFALGAGLSIVSRALTPKPDFGGMMRGVTGTVREPASTRKIIYGQVRVGGSVVFLANSNQNEYLYLVIAFASHEIESYEKFYFNDELVWDNGSFQGDWGSWALINRYDGTQIEADSTLSGASSYWSDTHVLSGVSYAMVRLKWDKDRKKFPNGVPNISAVIKGKKVYDPRNSTTAYSNNPVLCARDYLVNSYGLGEDSANIDELSFITAANICDQPVDLAEGGTQSRWACDGVIDTATSIKSNIEALLASMGGRLGYSGGKYFIQAAAYVTPVITIDESVMVGDIQVQTRQSRRSNYNGVKGVFLSEEANYTLVDYPAQISSSYALEDGDPIYLDMPLPFVTNNVRAQRLAKIALLKSRQQVSTVVPLNLAGLKLKAGDFIKINNTRLGWSEKPFEVLDYTLSASSDGAIVVNVSCIETDADVYDWSTGDQNPLNIPQTPDTNDGSTVEAPTTLVLAETTSFAGDGSLVDALSIGWTAAADGFVDYYEILIEEVSSGLVSTVTSTSTSYLFSPIRKGINYSISVFAVNTIGARSIALTGSLTPVGDQLAPSIPTSVLANGGNKSITLTWTNPIDNDLAFIDVYRAAEVNFAYSRIATVAVQKSTSGVYVDQGLENGEDYFYKLRAVDRSGNVSGFSSVASDLTDAREASFTPRDLRGYVYYQTATDDNPAPNQNDITATSFSFSSDDFVSLTDGWDKNPPEQTGADGTYWAARYQVIEDEYNGSQTIEFSSAFSSFSFDGLVTFTNLNTELGNSASSLITTVDGGLIKTGVVDLANQNGMAVRQGKTGYTSTTDGFWIGNDAGQAKVNVGDAQNYLKWDGNDLVTSGLKVYDSEGEIILDAGGGGLALEGGSIIRNGTLRDASKSSIAYFTNTQGASIIDGWETADGSSGGNLTSHWDEQGLFRFEGNHTVTTSKRFPVEYGETLYLAVNVEMPATYFRDWSIQVQFQNSSGSYVEQKSLDWDSPDWGDTVSSGGNRVISQAAIVVPNITSIRTCRVRIRGGLRIDTHFGYNDDDYYVKIWNVYLGRSPTQITGKTIDTYIRDLSVDTFKIQDEAVTLPEISTGDHDASVGYTEVELTDVLERISFSWSDVRDRPSKIILAASIQAGGDTNQRVTVQGVIKDQNNTQLAIASQSFRETDGGQTVVLGMVDLGDYANSITLKLFCRVFLGADGTAGSREIRNWTLTAWAAKK